MNFEFATATRIVFGAGSRSQLGVSASGLGKRALLVTGAPDGIFEEVSGLLADRGIDVVLWMVRGEPTLDAIRAALARAKETDRDLVVGVGGGSALDTGKAVAALCTNGGDPLDYLEVVGKGQPLTQPSLPFIALPTTSGTGSEVTRNAVLSVPEQRTKASLRSAHMLPRLALVDPELTFGVPPDVTACTGLDALTQVIEPFVCRSPNLLVDALCNDAIRCGGRSLTRVYEQPNDAVAREEMALVSLIGGLALANAKLGAVHGLAAAIGGMFSAPHGATCARLLPHVMDMNLRALKRRRPDSDALRRYDETARLLINHRTARAADGISWVAGVCDLMRIPTLRQYGLTERDLDEVISKALAASSMQGNPIELTRDELAEIVVAAL